VELIKQNGPLMKNTNVEFWEFGWTNMVHYRLHLRGVLKTLMYFSCSTFTVNFLSADG